MAKRVKASDDFGVQKQLGVKQLAGQAWRLWALHASAEHGRCAQHDGCSCVAQPQPVLCWQFCNHSTHLAGALATGAALGLFCWAAGF